MGESGSELAEGGEALSAQDLAFGLAQAAVGGGELFGKGLMADGLLTQNFGESVD